ncbi:hypothetical protein AGMMS50229_20900 [Campylobacterota bacterium]|nr:hypothetical protein AGMMS50229_20900 [Campylobacterota bacterium]
MSYWEFAATGAVAFLLLAGLNRLAIRRRTEILKEYFLPEETPLEQTILRPEKIAAKAKEEPADNAQEETPASN